MKEKLKEYVQSFHQNDEECYRQEIDNAHAFEWLWENAPLIDVPDKMIEQAYYFRWWTFRKHVKKTADGYVITEFLPPVGWAGEYNTIIAAAGHHISEARWLGCGKRIVEDYARFWLEERSKPYLYSTWILDSILEYSHHVNDFSFAIENLDRMVRYYETVEREHLLPCGLFWSVDNNDAMEFSISGTTEDGRAQKGIRPTMNSYMAANARAIAEIAERAERTELAKRYREKYESIRDRMNELLWDGGFYKAIHQDIDGEPSVYRIPASQNVRELIGYLPWCFKLAPKGRENAFAELLDPNGFWSENGLCTAEKRHPRFLYESSHECLWNGYVWPFATSQTLNAVLKLLEDKAQSVLTNEDFCAMLHTYAESHRRKREDGEWILWIDEVKHPITDAWSSRDLLRDWGWLESKGGYERGKDYNHSTFCDLVLGGLLGIRVKDGVLTVEPRIPKDWDGFRVENLWVCGERYEIEFDRDGKKYGRGAGLRVRKQSALEEMKR